MSLQIYICRPWIIWEICSKSLMGVKGQRACWFLQEFQLPLMVAFSHASMQWPFYLSFIPDCFQVSGRHSSWCSKCVMSNNNGTTAAFPESFWPRWRPCGQRSCAEVGKGGVRCKWQLFKTMFRLLPVQAFHFSLKQVFFVQIFGLYEVFTAFILKGGAVKRCWLLDFLVS